MFMIMLHLKPGKCLISPGSNLISDANDELHTKQEKMPGFKINVKYGSHKSGKITGLT